jgi:AcrR family transcriptional regulator
MITRAGAARQPTRQRLLQEGVRLFAENGFRETTVGEIEAAAGLEPRRGALYRHFPSKEALLEAALEAHLEGLADLGDDPRSLPPVLPDSALAFARWLFAELDRELMIVRILEQDGDRLPRLRDRFRKTLVDPAYHITAELARRWRDETAGLVDVDAIAAVLLGALVNYRRSTWTFGHTPAGISQDRYLSAWADLCTAFTALAANPENRP